MAIGFVGILVAQDLAMLIIGLAVFGGGMGMTYYAALYYAMSVGRAKVGAGGTHEALIGGGYMFGPLVGLLTLQVSSEGNEMSFQPLIIVVLILMIAAFGALSMIWQKAR
jgi:MFS family permease